MKSKTKEPTHKQILAFKDGEISMCDGCGCMTKTILKKGELRCGKCRTYK